jgi:hypothetical protein
MEISCPYVLKGYENQPHRRCRTQMSRAKSAEQEVADLSAKTQKPQPQPSLGKELEISLGLYWNFRISP